MASYRQTPVCGLSITEISACFSFGLGDPFAASLPWRWHHEPRRSDQPDTTAGAPMVSATWPAFAAIRRIVLSWMSARSSSAVASALATAAPSRS